MILSLKEKRFPDIGAGIRWGTNTIKVPKSLGVVTTIERAMEVEPESVGMTRDGVESIWKAVENLYRTGTHPGITLSVRRKGQVVMHRGIGYARGEGPKAPKVSSKVLMKPDTPVCFFSASKAVTALLMHMLNEDKLINLHDPISFYCPEFGQSGKKNTTIHQVLSHRSGVPGLPVGLPPETLWDNDEIWRLLCLAQPKSAHGDKLAYHALTGGYILERVLEHVTGSDIQTYLDERIRKPMGMKYFRYGVEDQYADRAADNFVTGVKPMYPVNKLIARALGGPVDQIQEIVNDPRFKRAVIPAGNIYGTAEEANRFFQMMLNDGEWEGKQICHPMTVRRATQEFASLQFDRTLMLPMRYSAGLMLGGEPFGLWGKHSGKAFGHIGLINKLCWADPTRDISVSLLTTGIPFAANVIPPLVSFLNRIDKHCPKVAI